MQIVRGESCHDCALERIDKACPEDIVADFGNPRIRGGRRNHRNFFLLTNRSGCRTIARCDFAKYRGDIVFVDQLADDAFCLIRLALIVIHFADDFNAVDPAGCVGLINRHIHSKLHRSTEGRFRAGCRTISTDHDLAA